MQGTWTSSRTSHHLFNYLCIQVSYRFKFDHFRKIPMFAMFFAVIKCFIFYHTLHSVIIIQMLMFYCIVEFKLSDKFRRMVIFPSTRYNKSPASWTYRRRMYRPTILLSEVRVLSKEFRGHLYLGRPWRLSMNEYLQIYNKISSLLHLYYFFFGLLPLHACEMFIPRTVLKLQLLS